MMAMKSRRRCALRCLSWRIGVSLVAVMMVWTRSASSVVSALQTARMSLKQPSISRKTFADSLLASIIVVQTIPGVASAADNQQFATSAGRRGCVTQSDPSRTIVTCTGELFTGDPNDSINSRLSGVAATENGVGTSAIKNPSRYSPPWTYLTETSDATVAWKSLQDAIVDAGATLEQVTDRYIHATAPTVSPPGLNSVDDLEFLLRPDDRVVLYRSVSRAAVFVYPLTQPVSDQNSNLKRLERIRTSLGWDLLQ